MSNKNDITFKIITTALRPQKIVSFIDSNEVDWIDISSSIIDFYSQCWGGNYNLIIPTNGTKIDNIFLEILKIYDPDYVYIYKKSYVDIKLNNPVKYKQILDKKYDTYYKSNPKILKEKFTEEFENQVIYNFITSFNINPKTKNEILNYTNPFNIKFDYLLANEQVQWPLTHIVDILFSTKLIGLIDVNIQNEKIFKLLCMSKLGSAKWLKNIDEKNFYENSNKKAFYHDSKMLITDKKVKEDQFYEFLKSILLNKNLVENGKINPYAATMINLGFYRPLNYISSKDPIVIVVGNEIEDFCLYYNISRLKDNVFWIPLPPKKNKNLNFFISALSKIIIAKFHSRSHKRIIFISKSIILRELKKFIKTYEDNEFIKTAIQKEAVENDLVKILPYFYKIYELNNYNNIYIEQFISNRSINFVNTPLPKAEHFNLNKIDTSTFRWINDLSIGLKKDENNDSRYILPKKAAFSNHLFDIDIQGTENELIRVTNEGFSYIGPTLSVGSMRDFVENVISKQKIKLLEPIDIFQTIFNSLGLKIKLSDKGSYLNETIKKFGSLKELASLLLDKKVFNLFKCFIKPRQKIEGNEPGIFLSSDRRRYLRFEDIKKVLRVNTQNLIDMFINIGVIHRGFIFKCSKCRNADWYAIKEIDNSFICKRCSNKEKYRVNNWSLKHESNEPKWYYKLDEIVHQGFAAHMETPIFTLFRIFNSSKKSFIYVPEINIYKENSREKPKEIDICCISDGEIIIGECTIENRLGNDQQEIEKLKFLKYIANNIGVKKVIISTLEKSLTLDLKNRINNIIPNIKILYTKKDLVSKIF